MLAFGWATHLAFVLVGLVIFIAGLGELDRTFDSRPRACARAAGRPARPPADQASLGTRRPAAPRHAWLSLAVARESASHLGRTQGGHRRRTGDAAAGLLYGLVSGQGIWLPINLLAGMVLPGVEQLSDEELQQFNPGC